MKKIFPALLLMLLIPALFPLTARAEEAAESFSYTSILYDNANGLPTSEANTIAQSADGFIWIGSYSGLIRYDGIDFYRFDSSNGISSVVVIYVDSKDRLWVGTNDKGVALYENGEFSFYTKADGLRSTSIRSIAEDPDGNILIATTHGIVYVDSEMAMHQLDSPQINEEYINELRSGADGVIYGESSSGSFFSIENLKVTSFYNGEELGINGVNCICPDPELPGFVYLGTEDNRVIHGDMTKGMHGYEVTVCAEIDNINRVYTDELKKELWVLADNGIVYVDDEHVQHRLKNIPLDNSIDGMLVDMEQNKWFVSSRQGVMKISPNRFRDLNLDAGLPSMVVNTTCLYEGKLYIGGDNGLTILDPVSLRQTENDLTERLKGIRIRAIKTDSAGNIWFCTYSDNGFLGYGPKPLNEASQEAEGGKYMTAVSAADGLPSNRVRTFAELSDGRLAVSASGGLSLIRDGRVEETFNAKSGISNTEILTICEGTDGRLYLGSDGDGIYILEGKKISRLGLEDGLSSEVILRIKKDTGDPSGDSLWIITSSSIEHMEKGKITTLDQFPYSNNFDLFLDHDQNAWILSSNGIFVVNRTELLANPEEMEYTLFDIYSGIPCVATANSRSCIDEDGTLYISGTTGVASVNINQMGRNDGDIHLSIPFAELDGQMISLKDTPVLEIPANVRRVTLYGYALTYTYQNPRLSYQLEGFDEEAFSVSRRDMQPVTYTNLDPGSYTFRLKLINAMTGEEEDAIAITLIKHQAFYQSIWFLLTAGLFFAALVGLIVYLYFRKKTERLLKEKERDQIFIDQTIRAFAKCIDMKDRITNGHSFRVAKYTALLAKRMGYSDEEIRNFYNIGLLHDIGKISIPDAILFKPDKLTDEEYAVMKTHTSNGRDVLEGIDMMKDLSLGAGYHHERIDGKGYPDGKAGDEIPKVAQIVAVADTYDTMHSRRPYKVPKTMEEITAELKRVAGTQLAADVVEVMLSLINDGVISDEENTSDEALKSLLSTVD